MEWKNCESTTEKADKVVRKMGIGWNLGNALDSCGLGHVSRTGADSEAYETQWKNPVISRELIHLIKELGYHAVRIPVTYYEHMDEDGNIDSAWLHRVEEIVEYVLEEGMYCVTNIQHDTGAGDQAWLRADEGVYDKVRKRYIRMWEQIGEVFRDYGERLLLEGFNEMLDVKSSWDFTDISGYETINRYNQLFVDTIRNSGGNNRERNLLLNTYGASPLTPAAKAFRLPEDISENHLIVGVHFYKPDAFSAGEQEYWNEDGEREVCDFYRRMDEYFLDKGIPVILGEWGTHDIRKEEERVKYARTVIARARERGMAYFWWDDGGKMRLVDRNSLSVVYPKLQKEITRL